MLKATASFRPASPLEVRSRRQGFEDEADELPFKRLTPEEATALRSRHPSLSPWRVIAVQAGLGLLIAGLAWGLSASPAVALSALYGALVVVLPGALMARGTTSPMARISAPGGAVSVMFWAVVKMGASVLMLLAAPSVVQPLSWPALLIALVVCMQIYWLALLWRGR